MPAYDYYCEDCNYNEIVCQVKADGGPESIPCPKCGKDIGKRWSGYGGLVYNEMPWWLCHHDKGTIAVVDPESSQAAARLHENPTRTNLKRMFEEDRLQWYEGSGYNGDKRRREREKEREKYREKVTREILEKNMDLGNY